MKKKKVNYLRADFEAISENESLARQTITSFLSQLDPEVSALSELRTAVSEAVTNCVVHAYKGRGGKIVLYAVYYDDRTVRLSIRDFGCGIEDIEQARRPLYTSDPGGERGGMGFTIMESFCDSLKVSSVPGKGTSVVMTRKLK